MLAGRVCRSRNSGVGACLVRPRCERCVARAAAAPAAAVARERVTFALFSELPSLVSANAEGRAAVPLGDWGERGPRAEHDGNPVEPKPSVKSPSDIGDAGGGALELAH